MALVWVHFRLCRTLVDIQNTWWVLLWPFRGIFKDMGTFSLKFGRLGKLLKKLGKITLRSSFLEYCSKFSIKRMLIFEILWHVYHLGPLFHSWTSKILSNLVILITHLHKEIVEKIKNITHCFNLWTFRPWILKSRELVDCHTTWNHN